MSTTTPAQPERVTLHYSPSTGIAWVVMGGADVFWGKFASLPIAATKARLSNVPVTHWQNSESPPAPMSLEGIGAGGEAPR